VDVKCHGFSRSRMFKNDEKCEANCLKYIWK
jgi:hypothetical protein